MSKKPPKYKTLFRWDFPKGLSYMVQTTEDGEIKEGFTYPLSWVLAGRTKIMWFLERMVSPFGGNTLTIEERIADALRDRKIRLTEDEVKRIASTPPKECWLCAYFIELIDEDEEGYFLMLSDLKDDGMKEHLRQLINREP